jgi:hypothetical protein
MTGIPLASDRSAARADVAIPAAASAAVTLSAALVIVGLGLAVVASPWYIDGALDRAGSPAILGMSPAQAHALSAQVVAELFAGPGTFAQTVAGPDGRPVAFFGSLEASHLRDVQVLARLLVLASLASAVLLAGVLVRAGGRAWPWRAVARGAGGLALGLVLVGLAFAVAFEPAFTAFHLVFFPGGNWAFDPREARMVQLYPPAFWAELVLAFGTSAVAIAALVWAYARRRAASGAA